MLSSFKWAGTAGPGSYHLSQAELTIPQQIKAYGLSERQYKKIFNTIKAQHNQNGDSSDFAHQSITTATLLYGNITRLANGLGIKMDIGAPVINI